MYREQSSHERSIRLGRHMCDTTSPLNICRIYHVFLIVTVIFCSGCADAVEDPEEIPNLPGQHEISEERAIEIAEMEYAENGGQDRYTTRIEKVREGYMIIIEDVPAKPGGHFVVYVSGDGRILKSMPGS